MGELGYSKGVIFIFVCNYCAKKYILNIDTWGPPVYKGVLKLGAFRGLSRVSPQVKRWSSSGSIKRREVLRGGNFDEPYKPHVL